MLPRSSDLLLVDVAPHRIYSPIAFFQGYFILLCNMSYILLSPYSLHGVRWFIYVFCMFDSKRPFHVFDGTIKKVNPK